MNNTNKLVALGYLHYNTITNIAVLFVDSWSFSFRYSYSFVWFETDELTMPAWYVSLQTKTPVKNGCVAMVILMSIKTTFLSRSCYL